MNIERRFLFWIIVAVTALALLWLFSGVIGPFLAGILIAYLCDPLCRKMEERGIPRIASGLILVGGATILIVGLVAAALPIVMTQASGYLTTLPDLRDRLMDGTLLRQSMFNRIMPEGWTERLISIGSDSISWLMESAGQVGLQILSGGLALFDFLTLLIITPLVAIYAMRDWPHLVTAMDDLVPPRHRPIVRSHAQTVDDTISAWLRGQVFVCLSLGLFYSVGLTLLGVQYGIFIGVVAGIASFIPFLGFAVGLVLSFVAALITFDSIGPILATIAIFLAGQVLESYFLTPKLVGRSVGLGEVWIIFALLAGGAVFGFVGILLAVPAAAVLGVLIRSSISAYKKSRVFLDDQ